MEGQFSGLLWLLVLSVQSMGPLLKVLEVPSWNE